MAEQIKLESKEWESFLRSAVAKAKNFGKLLFAAVSIFGFKDVIDHFENEEGPNSKWPDRLESTNRAYDIMGGKYNSSNKILQLSGDLRKEFLPDMGNLVRRDRLSVEMYSTKVYAHRHDMGTHGMPQREFLWLSDKAKGLILEMMMDQLVEG